jgi:hypothetical protein
MNENIYMFSDSRELARRIAEGEWKLAGSPPDQQAIYEARIQGYEQYPRRTLVRELNRLTRMMEDLRYQEELAQARAAPGPTLAQEEALMRAIARQERWTADNLEQALQRVRARHQANNWVAPAPGVNPAEIIGISTNAAPHIGKKNIPVDSENFISRDNIEDGDEMVELHGNPDHIYKKSSLNQWIATRKEQFPRNPIKNPYTGQNIKQQNMKRYTASMLGGGCGCNGTRRMYGGYKKRKSLRLRHKVTRKTRRVSRSRRR